MARQSTDEKLRDIINGPDDEENFEGVIRQEQAAKNHLRRTSLYGGGARAKIPQVKHVQNNQLLQSPFNTEPSALTQEKLEHSAIPPGAHSDQYRIVQFPTEKSFNDPDRVFYTTKSLTEGIRTMQQPPWYYGTENKTYPSDSSLLLSAGRYGYRGSRDIQQKHTAPFLAPNRTKTPYTPKFLDTDEFVNEYVQPIVMSTFQSVNSNESPKLWPETTEFVTGYPKKRSSTSHSYNRQTTTATVSKNDPKGETTRPRPSSSLRYQIDRALSEDEVLNQFAKAERHGQMKSLTQCEIDKVNGTWNDRVSKTANASLRMSMKKVVPPYEAHTLLDTTDSMRYSGTTALIVHSQSSDEIKFRYNLASTSYTQPYQLRWKLMCAFYHTLCAKLKRDQTVQALTHDLALKLHLSGVMAGTPSMIKRSDFIKTLEKVKQLEGSPKKELSLLFSIFDNMKKNVIRYVCFLAAVAALDNPKQCAMEKLSTLYSMHEQYGSDMAPLEMCLSVLCTCCATDQDRTEMEQVFKSSFCKAAYKFSILNTSAISNAPLEEENEPTIDELEKTQVSRVRVSTAVTETQAAAPAPVVSPYGAVRKSKSAGTLGTGSASGSKKKAPSTADSNYQSYGMLSPPGHKTNMLSSPVPGSFGGKFDSSTASSTGGGLGAGAPSPMKSVDAHNKMFNVSSPMRSVGTLDSNVVVNRDINTDNHRPQHKEKSQNAENLNSLSKSNVSLALPSTGSIDKKVKRDLAVQPPFNICDAVISRKVFLKILLQCPDVVSLFDSQLEARMIACHGKDVRQLNKLDDEDDDGENKDYSWIIKSTNAGKSKQRERPNIFDKPSNVPPQTAASVLDFHG